MKIRYVGPMASGTVDWRGGCYNFVKDEWYDWPPDLVAELTSGTVNLWEADASRKAKNKKEEGKPWR